MIVLLMIIYQPRGIIELFEKIGQRFSRKHNDEGGRSGAEDPSGA